MLGHGRKRSSSAKGGGKGSRRKTKSDDHAKKAHRKPKEGPRRSLSSTCGYTPQPGDNSMKYNEHIAPYDPAHVNEKCLIYKNMDNGRPVKGHKAGSPLCPLVQAKKYPQHPRFDKTGWKPSG